MAVKDNKEEYMKRLIRESLFEKDSEDSSSEDKGGESKKKDTDSEDIFEMEQYEDMKEEEPEVYKKLAEIHEMLGKTFKPEKGTFKVTHSQIAYFLYPDLDEDSARSKFSQKFTGKKHFTSKEINSIYSFMNR